MTILHVSAATSWRGGEQQVAYLLLELKSRNIEQMVLCPEKSALASFCTQNEIPLTVFKKRSGFDPFLALKITQLCRNFKKPVLHAHDSHAHTAAVLSGLLWMNKTPIIIHRRVSFNIKNSPFSHFKYNYHKIKHIICVSQSVKQNLDQQLKNSSKTSVIYSAIDLKKFEGLQSQNYLRNKYQLNSQNFLIGNISALTPEKDLYTFINTSEILLKKYEHLRFFIIGEGSEKQNLIDYIDKKGLNGKVFLTGFIQNPQKILPELDVFLFTSLNEGLGTSILDAMASKVAVVATCSGGIPEIVKHNTTGFCIEPKNSVLLADGVSRLKDNPTLRETFIENAYQMLNDFSVSEMCEKTLRVYSSALAE